jgi:16S rRNA (cytosine1402-N4)-methyltransferase
MATLTYMPAEHVPVLAPELIALVDPGPGDVVVDCTFGGGGHARLAAERIGPTGTLVAIDRDPVAAGRFAELEPELGSQARFEPGDFAHVLARLAAEGMRADVVLMDLGISSLQLDNWERGFSYSYDAPLDMRMDTGQDLSALEIVNEWPAQRIEQILRDYGEERYARSIAAEVARRRPLETTSELVEAIRAAVPPAYRFGRGHPAKRSFQAIRIAVNGELDSLDRGLEEGWGILNAGGRLGAISFHSLEDRRVKRFFADLARGCVCPPEIPVCVCGHEPEAELVTKRAVKPAEGEIERNPRSSSARLRAAIKLGDAGSPRPHNETRPGSE